MDTFAHTQTRIGSIIHIMLYAKIRGRRTTLNYFSVRQDPGKAYQSKRHQNTHPVTVGLKETPLPFLVPDLGSVLAEFLPSFPSQIWVSDVTSVLYRWQKMWRVTFVTFLGRMWRSRTRKCFLQVVTFFVTSFTGYAEIFFLTYMTKSSSSSPTNQPTNPPFWKTQRLGFFS